MKSNKLKIWESSLLIALCIGLFAGVWAQGRQSSISSGLVRLHVIAVSDAEYEQQLKLRVRDAVLDFLAPKLSSAGSPAQAKEIISANLMPIAEAAASAAEGRQVSVSLSRECYPSRVYEGFTLPAGSYASLRIVLGEGKGQNWWCIAFPPLCLDVAQCEQLQSVMSEEDFAIVSSREGYELRLRIVELWGQLTNRLKQST